MSKGLRSMLNVGAEGAIDGNVHKEIEFTFYGRLKDPSQLEKAVHIEEHEQWRVPFKIEVPGLRQRIRMIDGRRWVLSTKQERDSAIGWDEIECDISKDMFNTLRLAGTHGYKKTRYVFPVPGTDKIWEIDVFPTRGGDKSLWVKIDLEVNDPNAPIPAFPLDFLEMITNQDVQQTQEEKAFLDKLWNLEWARLDS